MDPFGDYLSCISIMKITLFVSQCNERRLGNRAEIFVLTFGPSYTKSDLIDALLDAGKERFCSLTHYGLQYIKSIYFPKIFTVFL